MQERQYLSIVILSPNETEILKSVSLLAAQHRCQVVNCHVMTHGSLYNLSLLLSGEWGAIAKIEPKLHALARKLSFSLLLKRTLMAAIEKPQLPYVLYVISKEDASIFHQLIQFLHQQAVVITEVFIDTYTTRSTQILMTNATIKIQLAADLSISDWRERFMLFCDELNFDAIMEPEKL